MRKAIVIPARRGGRPPLFGTVAALLIGMTILVLVSLGWQRLVTRLADAAPTATAALPGDVAQPVGRGQVRVIDGDTIDLDGRRVRLVGFNAPETWKPACAAEASVGARAKSRLRELVASRALSYRPIACSCAPGTEGTEACNHGRACGSLFAGGRDVGDILVSEQLAVPYACGRRTCPPLPRPWCG